MTDEMAVVVKVLVTSADDVISVDVVSSVDVVAAASEEVVVVGGASLLADEAEVDSAAGGGRTLKVAVAPHSASVLPSGQQPPSVQ